MKTIKVPLVITLENLEYHGFTPGIAILDVISQNKEQCLEELKKQIKQELKKIIKNNYQMPFFPSKKEILEDFENVCNIYFFELSY